MPWEKQFDIDAALDGAVAAFWARGYEATSVRDLLDSMDINRGSLYATFGDKRSLFLQALRRYDETHRDQWLDRLSSGKTPRERILATFESVIEGVLGDGARDGCLLINTALELSPHDPEIAAIVAEALSGMEAFFRANIEAGQAAGEIPTRVEAAETASALLGLFVGLRVLSRSRPEAPLLRSISRQAAVLLA